MYHRNPQPHQPQRQLVAQRLPEPSELGALIVRSAQTFAVRHKYITGWYLLGMLVLAYLSAYNGRPLSPQQHRKYSEIMDSINLQAEYDAADAFYVARQHYYATKGWFWSCDGVCQRARQRMRNAEQRWNAVRAEGNARMSDAKSVAGLSSVVAVEEMKDSFWQYFTAGKQFAKRQTVWDIVWMSLRGIARGRDESWAEYAVKILMHVLMNFTIGLLSSLLFFVLGLWNIVRSYQPNPLMAVAVFLAASAAASAFVATYLLGLFGAAAGGVYGLAKVAESQARIGAGNQRRERLHYE